VGESEFLSLVLFAEHGPKLAKLPQGATSFQLIVFSMFWPPASLRSSAVCGAMELDGMVRYIAENETRRYKSISA
jgi:hypothetical protein